MLALLAVLALLAGGRAVQSADSFKISLGYLSGMQGAARDRMIEQTQSIVDGKFELDQTAANQEDDAADKTEGVATSTCFVPRCGRVWAWGGRGTRCLRAFSPCIHTAIARAMRRCYLGGTRTF